MKCLTNYASLKVYFRFLGIFAFLLFQNCTVYRGASVNIDKAIEQESKVVVVTSDGDKLKFKKLIKKDQSLIGVVKKKRTFKYLDEKGLDYSNQGGMRHYILDSLKINEIYPKNKTISTFVSIGVGAVVLITTLVIIIVTSLAY